MTITHELHVIFIRENPRCWVSLYVISPRLLSMPCCFGDALAACTWSLLSWAPGRRQVTLQWLTNVKSSRRKVGAPAWGANNFPMKSLPKSLPLSLTNTNTARPVMLTNI